MCISIQIMFKVLTFNVILIKKKYNKSSFFYYSWLWIYPKQGYRLFTIDTFNILVVLLFKFFSSNLAPMMKSYLQHISFLRTSTKVGIWKGSKNWRNGVGSIWSSKQNTLRNKTYFVKKSVTFEKLQIYWSTFVL